MENDFLKGLHGLIGEDVNTIVLGRKGSGKSFVLKQLGGCYFANPNLGVDDLRSVTKVRGSLTFQISLLLSYSRGVLVIDNLHEATPKKKQLIIDLSRVHTIVAASLYVPNGFEHWHTIELPTLSQCDCEELLSENKLDEEKKDEIIKKAKGNPGKLLHMASMQEKLGYYKMSKDASMGFNLSQFTNYLLSVRYFFMFTRQWRIYSLVSMFTYALVGYNRRRRYYK